MIAFLCVLVGAVVRESRRLTIPASLAYGRYSPSGAVPAGKQFARVACGCVSNGGLSPRLRGCACVVGAGSTVVVDVELISVLEQK